MTEIANATPKPTIKLHGSDFILEFDPAIKIAPDSCELQVSCHDTGEFFIRCKLQPDSNGKTQLGFPLHSVRIPSLVKAVLVLNKNSIDISGLLLHYQLDKDKLHDNVYLSNNVFNASARNFSADDLFVVATVYLNTLAIDNQNFGGLITLLSYRITDKLDERAELLDSVYEKYRDYLDNVNTNDAIAFRWLVSCSSTLTTALLSIGAIEQAAEVVDSSLKLIVHPSLNPMCHQNFALLLFQGGLIKAWQGHFNEATSLFIGAVNASRHGMTDLLHPQNNWVLGQMSDCRKFLSIFEASLSSALACSKGKLPPASRFSVMKPPAKLAIHFHTLFDRFECCKKTTPLFFKQVLQKMQAHQNQH